MHISFVSPLRVLVRFATAALILSLFPGSVVTVATATHSVQLTATATPSGKGGGTNPTPVSPKSPSAGYDILSFMAPPSGSLIPTRGLSDCYPAGFSCGPPRLKSPIWLGGTNGGGIYQGSNIFYMLKDDAPPGSGGYTTFEKYGYDDTYIWISRDGHWGSGASLSRSHPVPKANPRALNVAPNGNDYNVSFPQYFSVADVSGQCPGCRFDVNAGTVSTGYWAKRYMNLYDFVDIGYQYHNIPNWIYPFNRDRTTGTWQPADGSYVAPVTVELYDHNTTDFGGVVGPREYIVLRRFVDATHSGCDPTNGCPYSDERYWYAKGIGLVRFELYEYQNPNPNPKVTWANAAADFGPVWDVGTIYTSPPTASIDPANDHVYVNLASQMASKHVQVFFSTNQENWYSADKSASLSGTNDGSWYGYDFNFSGNPKWKGTITGIRLDPTDGTGGATWYSSCGCLGWQRIRIGTETKSAYSAIYDIGSNGDTQGFSTYNLNAFSWVLDAGKWKWIMAPFAGDPQIYRNGISVASGR